MATKTISAHDAQRGLLFTAEILSDLGGGLLRVAVPTSARPTQANIFTGRGPCFCTVTANGTGVSGSYGDSA